MGTQIPIPTGFYSLPDPRASCRDMINCFSESAPQDNFVSDSKQKFPPVLLRRAAGITPFAQYGTSGPVRGLWMMGGIEYAVIGPSLYTLSTQGTLAQIGSGIIGGVGVVRMTDNTQC